MAYAKTDNSTSYVAKDREKSTNEVDSSEVYSNQIEHGWAMYHEGAKDDSAEELKEALQKGSPTDKTVIMLLSEILKVNKENRDINQKILEVLQKSMILNLKKS